MRQKSWFYPSIHIVIWLVYISLPILLHAPPQRHEPIPPHPQEPNNQWQYLMMATNLIMVPIFYFNTFFLAIRYLNTRKYGLFSAWQLVLMTLVYFALSHLFNAVRHDTNRPLPLLTWVINYALVVTAAVAYHSFKEQLRQERIQKQKENETLKSELQFLRWQISPHFLFNVLNNLVALARLKSERIEPMLLRLSSLMRYMLYETDERKITLEQETEYLQDYIALQTMRFGDSVTVFPVFKFPENATYTLEPMLLVPFVENAFKHGTGLVENPEIHLSLIEENGMLHFEVKNKFTTRVSSKDEAHGIGLANVQRRLNLLYQNRYQLTIDRNDNWFIARLQINLV